MSKIRLETISEAMAEIKKLQRVCKKWRAENEDLRRQLAKFKDLDRSMPDFLKGFNNERR